MKCRLRTRRVLEVTSCTRQWHVEAPGASVGTLRRCLALDSLLEPWGMCSGRGALALRCCRSQAMASWSSPSPQPWLQLHLCWAGRTQRLSVWSHLCLPLSTAKGGTLLGSACCHLLTLSHLIFLFSCHSSPCSCTFPGRVWCLQRCCECPQWWTFIFVCRPSRDFLSPLTHSSQFCIFFPLEYFSHQFSFSFPLGSSRITKPQFTVSENRRYFPPLSLSCFGICNLLPPFYFLTKSNVCLTWWPT